MRQTITSLTFAALTLAAPTLAALPASADEIRVMTFNIWLGGDQVSMSKTLEAIRAADADVVLLQEPEGATLQLAQALGYAYAAPRQHLLSRFPIFDASDLGASEGGGDFAYLEIAPGRFIALANVHLDWTDYGPYGARDGKTAEEVLASEQALRESGIRAYIDLLEPIAASGMPVILGGDFNSPGDDWTAAMVGTFPHIKYQIAWPAAGAMRAAGYLDSFRTAHPDALANPGITWSWGYPQPTLWDGETQDRIDLLFGRNVKVIASQLVGGEGLRDVEIAVSPWPSDHQAVVSTFEVEGAPAPTLIYLPQRAVQQGDILAIRYSFDSAPDGRLEDGWVEILDQGAASGAPHQILYSNDTTDRMALIRAATYNLAPGAYDAALLNSEGTELARATFFVQAPGTRTTIATDKESYKAGETIIAKISAAPGNRYDWLAIFPEGEADQWNYLASAYTGAIIDGEVILDEATLGLQLDPGRYEVRFLLDDGYRAIAASPVFEVTAN